MLTSPVQAVGPHGHLRRGVHPFLLVKAGHVIGAGEDYSLDAGVLQASYVQYTPWMFFSSTDSQVALTSGVAGEVDYRIDAGDCGGHSG